MSALTRTAVGHFKLSSATELEDVSRDSIAHLVRPALEALPELTQVQMSPAQMKTLENGGEIHCPDHADTELAALTPSGQLAALLVERRPHFYGPQRNFSAAS